MISVRFKILTMANIKSKVFWDVLLSSLVNECQHFKGTCLLQNGNHSSNLKMEEAESYETVVFIYQTT
jgi:hypothetical protein